MTPHRPDPPPRWFVLSAFGMLVAVTLVQAFWVIQRAVGVGGGMLAYDYALYMNATRRWLAGGSSYVSEQISGPYVVDWGQILYPPQALALFVPFAFLPPLLWFVIPPAVTGWVIWSHRPRLLAWATMVGLLLVWPVLVLLPYIAGTPTTWIVMFVALGTRWRWVSALAWLKPSVFPFALLGARDRRWWVATGAVTALELALLPLTIDWVRVVLNAGGPSAGLFYSLENVPLLPVPLLAWIGRGSAKGFPFESRVMRPRLSP